MPAEFIKFPARIKNGTANNGKDCVPETIRWTVIEMGKFGSKRKYDKQAIPIAKATGILRKSSMKKITANSTI
jgi:hypothetical protein